MLSASQSAIEETWFEEDSYYLYPLIGVTRDMVSRDLTLRSSSDTLAEGQH